MAPSFGLDDLLKVTGQPTPQQFQNTIRTIKTDPSSLSNLSEEIVATSSVRLGVLFKYINTAGSELSLEQKKLLAKSSTLFIEKSLDSIQECLNDDLTLQILIPALSLAIGSQDQNIKKIAATDMFLNRGLPLLCHDKAGGELIAGWVKNRTLIPENKEALESWSSCVVRIILDCTPKQHELQKVVQKWHILRRTKDRLRKLRDRIDAHREFHRLQASAEVESKTTMLIALDPDMKKSRGPSFSHEHEYQGPEDTELLSLLQEFSMEYPKSSRMIQLQLEKLEHDETLSIMTTVSTSFPCPYCYNPASKNFLSFGVERLLPRDTPVRLLGEPIGKWRIIFSSRFKRNLDAVDDLDHRVSIFEALRKLSNFEASRFEAVTTEHSLALRVPLVKTFCRPCRYILWQIEIAECGQKGYRQQQIKIWDLGFDDEIARTIPRVALLQQSYSRQYVDLCLQSNRLSPDTPLIFSETGQAGLPATDAGKATGTALDPEEDRPTASSDRGPRRDSKLKDNCPSRPNLANVDEEAVELATKYYQLTPPAFHVLEKQDFVAEIPLDLSGEQIDMIENFRTSSVTLGRSGTGKTTCLVYKMVARYLQSRQSGRQSARQVLITASPLLAEKLLIYTKELLRTFTTEQQRPPGGEDCGEPTPTASSDSEFKRFPLVCTFYQFLNMLDAIQRATDPPDCESETRIPSTRVDANSFRLDYWPNFPEDLKKSLSPALVFSEILGVIKGSTFSSRTLRPRSQQEYADVSRREAPIFTLEQEREKVYQCYLQYEKLKKARQGFDDVDRVLSFLAVMGADSEFRGHVRNWLQEIYVDEVQDQRTVDVALFLNIVEQPCSLHLAGDTAQTISLDSNFRFNDVKDLYHDHFSEDERGRQPMRMHSLVKNYRSHQGILSLASFVMKLLYAGFPDTIDKLDPEIGIFMGPKPVLFVACDPVVLFSTGIGFVELSGSAGNFGADQVILVRDADTKAALNEMLGDAALILTIRDSKGMEFEDVILWDFFSSCANTRAIRQLENLLDRRKAASYAHEHVDMCSELKNLYVAVTRARIQFFLFESSQTIIEPVVRLLRNRPHDSLVEVVDEDDADFHTHQQKLHPGRSADPRRWLARGKLCLENQQWEDAGKCFRRAGDEKGQKLVKARIAEEEGRTLMAQERVDSAEVKAKFEEALALYFELSMTGDAAELLTRMGRLVEAAELWSKAGEHLLAADSFHKAGNLRRAASSYEAARKFEDGTTILQRGGDHDEYVDFVSRNKAQMGLDHFKRCQNTCKIFLKRGLISDRYRSAAIELIGPLEEQERFFRDFSMIDDLVQFLQRHRKYAELLLLEIQMMNWERVLEMVLDHGTIYLPATGIPDLLQLTDRVVLSWLVPALQDGGQERPTLPFLFKSSISGLEEVSHRLAEWNQIIQRLPWDPASIKDTFESISTAHMRSIFALLTLLYTQTASRYTSFDDICFPVLREATAIARNIILTHDAASQDLVQSVLGYWDLPFISNVAFQKFSWSPISDPSATSKKVHLDGAQKHFLDIYSKVMISFFARPSQPIIQSGDLNGNKDVLSHVNLLDTQGLLGRARILHDAKWPRSCVHYVTRNRCQETQCKRAHEHTTRHTFEQSLQDLMMVVEEVCELRGLFYQHVLPDDFQNQFLPLRRFWLERTIAKLTPVSGFEHDVMKIHGLIQQGRFPVSILSNLEDLLFFRLGREWLRRKTFGGILEQIQLANFIGPEVESRILRSLYHKLGFDRDPDARWREATIPKKMESAVKSHNHDSLASLVMSFTQIIRQQSGPELTSLQSILELAEWVVTFILLSMPGSACLLPESWVARFQSWNAPLETQPSHTLSPNEKEKYIKCLFGLADGFSHMLETTLDPYTAKFSLIPHPFLVQQRNAEFLAILFANLSRNQASPVSVSQSWQRVVKVRRSVKTTKRLRLTVQAFETPLARAPDYRIGKDDLRKLPRCLTNSFARYQGKDRLLVVLRNTAQSALFQDYSAAVTVQLANILSRFRVVHKSSATPVPDEDALHYSEDFLNAVVKIQKWWRAKLLLLKLRQEHLKTEEGQVWQKYIDLGGISDYKTQFRAQLVEEGPKLDRFLSTQSNRLDHLRTRILSCLEAMDLNEDDDQGRLNGMLSQISNLQDKVQQGHTTMVESNLAKLVSQGDVEAMKVALSSVRSNLKAVSKTLSEIDRGLGKLLKAAETKD